MAELVHENVTGLTFNPGDAVDLAAKARYLIENPAETRRMGREARIHFETRYSGVPAHRKLMEIYGAVLADHHA